MFARNTQEHDLPPTAVGHDDTQSALQIRKSLLLLRVSGLLLAYTGSLSVSLWRAIPRTAGLLVQRKGAPVFISLNYRGYPKVAYFRQRDRSGRRGGGEEDVLGLVGIYFIKFLPLHDPILP